MTLGLRLQPARGRGVPADELRAGRVPGGRSPPPPREAGVLRPRPAPGRGQTPSPPSVPRAGGGVPVAGSGRAVRICAERPSVPNATPARPARQLWCFEGKTAVTTAPPFSSRTSATGRGRPPRVESVWGVGIRRFPSMPKSACCARVHPIVLSATRPCATRAPRKLPRCLATPGGKDDSLRTCRWGARNRAPRAAQGPAAPSLPGSGAEWSRAPVRPRFHPAGAASGPSARARTTRPLAATTPNSGRGASRVSTWVS